MILYFNTEAEYEAAAKSAFESQVALVGATNNIHYDGRNVVVGINSAMTGDAVVLDGNSALHFIHVGTFSSSSFMSNYTKVGVVLVGIDHPDYRGEIMIGAFEASAQPRAWSYIYSFRLTGYTLDGTDRTGVLSIRQASDNYAVSVDYTVPYNASTVTELVAQLNTFFRDTTNVAFQQQDWVAMENDGAIDLVMHFIAANQRSDTGKSGFTLTANTLPEITATTAMLRYNGQGTGEGCVINMPRALAYFRSDLDNETYNPKTTQTAAQAKRSYPICLPGYLGTSAYSGGEDRCAAIRAIYGEGEAGWLKFMESFYPVRPTAYGSIGDKSRYGDGKRNTYVMAGKTFTRQDGTTVPAYPAANYCASFVFNHELLKAGEWFLPDTNQLASIMRTIKYPSTNNRNADPINQTLYAIGAAAIANSAYCWSSSRCSAGGAWLFGGGSGFFGNGYLGGSYRALPVVLLKVNEVNA